MPENCRKLIATSTDLIDDLKQCILDFISLPSDLLNICLISKSWNSIATKRLYEHVILSGDAQLVSFDHCLNWGASKHLHHTRKLSILERWDKDIQDVFVRKSFHGDTGPNDGPDLIDLAIMQVVRSLPNDHLHTVRLLPLKPIGMNCLKYLCKHQKRLAYLYVNTIPLPWTGNLVFRDMTVGFHTAYDKTRRLEDLLEQLSSHAALTLAFWGGWTSVVHRHWLRWTDSMMRKVALQQLTVYGSMPDSFWAVVSGRLDLSHLTSLTLIKCDFESLEILHTTIQSLVSLHICLGSNLGESRLFVLEDLFNNNVELRHVHLDIHDTRLEYDPRTIPNTAVRLRDRPVPPPLKERAYLWPLRHKIRSMSLNDGDFVECIADENVRAGDGPRLFTSELKELYEVCHHFQKLQQFGWNVCEPRTASEELDILDPLKQLKDLRIFHAYQQYFTLSKEHHKCGCEDVLSHLHHFAVQFFQTLHPHCPELQVFVWGLCGGLFTPGGAPLGGEFNGSAPIRQHIFVKQTMVLPDEELQITAVPVSRAWVRHKYPDLDLLQRDPGLYMADPGNHLLGW